MSIFIQSWRVPPNPGERYYRKLLESNFFGCETGAASLGCDPETSEVLLWRLINIEGLEAEELDLFFRSLCNRLPDSSNSSKVKTWPSLLATIMRCL